MVWPQIERCYATCLSDQLRGILRFLVPLCRYLLSASTLLGLDAGQLSQKTPFCEVNPRVQSAGVTEIRLRMRADVTTRVNINNCHSLMFGGHSVLLGPQFSIERARSLDEASMRASLHDPPLPQHQDFISIDNGRETVGYEDGRLSTYYSVHGTQYILQKTIHYKLIEGSLA